MEEEKYTVQRKMSSLHTPCVDFLSTANNPNSQCLQERNFRSFPFRFIEWHHFPEFIAYCVFTVQLYSGFSFHMMTYFVLYDSKTSHGKFKGGKRTQHCVFNAMNIYAAISLRAQW